MPQAVAKVIQFNAFFVSTDAVRRDAKGLFTRID
jgi:hypothetical protein